MTFHETIESPSYFAPDSRALKRRRAKPRRSNNENDEYGSAHPPPSHTREDLNEGQKRVYDHMMTHRTDILVLQAGPGTGKTYTMLPIAQNWKSNVIVIIFKHDLLEMFANVASRRYTLAKFFMELMDLRFTEYTSMEQELSGLMSFESFILAIVGLLARARIPTVFKRSLVILDEYTVIPKPLLFIMLALFKRHGIAVIVTGDKDQLQNIHNSRHAQISSFEIAQAFANKTMTLTKNERCQDKRYNEIVSYVASYSSSQNMTKYGFALAAAIFPRNLMRSPYPTDCFLAAWHSELTESMFKMTMNYGLPTSFYMINGANARKPEEIQGRRMENGLYRPVPVDTYEREQRVSTFLPFIPLILKGRYFVNEYSEYSCGTLESIDLENRSLLMKLEKDNSYISVSPCECNNIVFDKHRAFLFNKQQIGHLYNYPISLASTMSLHMAQGRTVSLRANFLLNKTTFQAFYVAVSRVRSPDQVNAVVIPDQIDYLVSTIVNFPELCEQEHLTRDDIERGMRNYHYYSVPVPLSVHITQLAVGFFIDGRTSETRREIRAQLYKTVMQHSILETLNEPSQPEKDKRADTLYSLVGYQSILLALGWLDPMDRNVWVHEFLRHDKELLTLMTGNFTQFTSIERESFTTLQRITSQMNNYNENETTLEYIERFAVQKPRDVDRFDQYWIKEWAELNEVLETTEFHSKIFDLLSVEGECTKEWLLKELVNLVAKRQAIIRKNVQVSEPETKEFLSSNMKIGALFKYFTKK